MLIKDQKLDEIINNANDNIGKSKTEVTYDEDGNKVETTITIKSPEWEYRPIPFVNTLKFNDKKSTTNVKLHMSNKEATDTDIKITPPPVKHYGFPNLF